MKSNKFKSVLAVVAGFMFILVTHTTTDAVLEAIGFLPKGNLYTSAGVILVVIFYRAIFSLGGCYITAKLAPSNPKKHCLILGSIGTLLSIGGAIAAANMDLGPAWYAWTLVVIALPIAWTAGRLYVILNPHQSHADPLRVG